MHIRSSAGLLLMLTAFLFSFDHLSATTTELSLSTGYQHTNLKHSLDSDLLLQTGLFPPNPKGLVKHNVRLHSWNIKGQAKVLTEQNYYGQMTLSCGWLIKKAKEELDTTRIFPLNPLMQIKESKKSSKHGHLFDGSVSVGKRIELASNLSLLPQVGLAYSQITVNQFQNLNKFNGVPYQAKQKVRWVGPFIALDMPINFENGMRLTPGLEYHRSKYTSKIIGDGEGRFPYRGSRWGNIYKLKLELDYALTSQWSLNLGYRFEYKEAKSKEKAASLAFPYYVGKAKDKIRQKDHLVNFGISYSF